MVDLYYCRSGERNVACTCLVVQTSRPSENDHHPPSSSFMPPNNPKTPTRHRSRSETKTPLTPSLAAALNSIAHNSPTKSRFQKQPGTAIGDVTNPFIATTSKSTSRPPSPIKRLTGGIYVTDSLAKQAGGGIIKKGSAESRIDVITRDYVPPPKTEMKRSRSTPANRPVGSPLRSSIDYRGADI